MSEITKILAKRLEIGGFAEIISLIFKIAVGSYFLDAILSIGLLWAAFLTATAIFIFAIQKTATAIEQHKLAAVRENLDEVEQTLENSQKQIADAEKQIKALIAEKEAILMKSQSKIDEIFEQNEMQKEQIVFLEKQNADLEKQIAAAEEQNAVTEEQIAAAEKQNLANAEFVDFAKNVQNSARLNGWDSEKVSRFFFSKGKNGETPFEHTISISNARAEAAKNK